MKKGELNLLVIAVIIVGLFTIGTVFYMVFRSPSLDDYSFDAGQDFTGQEKVLVGTPEVEQPAEVALIKMSYFVIGSEQNGRIVPRSEFELGETIVINTTIKKFSQPKIEDGRRVYAIEQWVSTQDSKGKYVTELTAMTANFSRYADAPVDNVMLKNKLDTNYLVPGNYTMRVFVVDRLTQEIDMRKEVITII